MCDGTRLHFHEILKDRFWKAKHLEKGHTAAVVPSEARALYEFLRDDADVELGDVVSQVNFDAGLFIVRRPPRAAAESGVCGGPGA